LFTKKEKERNVASALDALDAGRKAPVMESGGAEERLTGVSSPKGQGQGRGILGVPSDDEHQPQGRTEGRKGGFRHGRPAIKNVGYAEGIGSVDLRRRVRGVRLGSLTAGKDQSVLERWYKGIATRNRQNRTGKVKEGSL